MSQAPSTVCPDSIFAGDTVDFAVNAPSCSEDDGFTALFVFQTADGKTRKTVAGIDYSGAWRCTATSAVTALWPQNDYTVLGFATDGTDRRQIFQGKLIVQGNVYTSGNIDIRSDNRKNLDAIKAVMAKRATHDQLSVSISGQTLQMTPVEQLFKLLNYYEKLVSQEENQADTTGRLGRKSKIVPMLPC